MTLARSNALLSIKVDGDAQLALELLGTPKMVRSGNVSQGCDG